MNPFDGLAKYFLGRLEQKIIQGWIRLIFQMGISGLITFLFIAGGCLVAGQTVKFATGMGMTWVAVVLTVYCRKSALTRGMFFVLPAAEGKKEIESNIQTISHS